MKYTTKRVIEKLERGENVGYIFFWGHTKTELTSKSCLSQWYDVKFIANGVKFCSSEQWMMAEKALLFRDKESYTKIISTSSPKEIKALGRKVKYFNQRVWEENRFEIVLQGNLLKFGQNLELLDFIKKSKQRVLVEASPVDQVWGIGMAQNHPDILAPYCWKGENLLGYALMEVRDALYQFDGFKPLINPVLPPWLAYPEYDKYSIGWSMGCGEDYMRKLHHYYSKLDSSEQITYKLTYPVIGEWKGWYDD